VIHTRDAWEDTFAVLASEGVPPRTVFHCFTAGPSEAERCLGLDAYISYSGIVTFKTAEDNRAALRITPIERLLIETDAPYLAPVPHRGERNRPALVAVVGEYIAGVLGLDVDTVQIATWQNTAAAFRLAEAERATRRT
jgi:TatD DNase family protein